MEITELAVQIARLDEKLDAHNIAVRSGLQDIKDVTKDHEDRVRSLEKARWRMHGVGAAVALLISGVVSMVKMN